MLVSRIPVANDRLAMHDAANPLMNFQHMSHSKRASKCLAATGMQPLQSRQLDGGDARLNTLNEVGVAHTRDTNQLVKAVCTQRVGTI